jgi:hypothetical protein
MGATNNRGRLGGLLGSQTINTDDITMPFTGTPVGGGLTGGNKVAPPTFRTPGEGRPTELGSFRGRPENPNSGVPGRGGFFPNQPDFQSLLQQLLSQRAGGFGGGVQK